MSQLETEIEAAVFRRLLKHFDERKDVQNIDLMNLAGFCRNCLSKWYRAEAGERGLEMDLEVARTLVYGMPYSEWKAEHQAEASAEQLAQFQAQAESEGSKRGDASA
ncbi:MAG: DUF1244 domain-containing protein [Gammaproteobacteria bacterium]|nr:DUF1244 domain-containing protein [Gammaproteobacteria bacterium]